MIFYRVGEIMNNGLFIFGRCDDPRDNCPALQVELDGKEYKMLITIACLQDMAWYSAALNTIRTPAPTEEEVADWQRYDNMLGDAEFMKNARSRVKIEYNSFEDGRKEMEEIRKWNIEQAKKENKLNGFFKSDDVEFFDIEEEK